MTEPNAMPIMPLDYASEEEIPLPGLVRAVLWTVMIQSAADVCRHAVDLALMFVRQQGSASAAIVVVYGAWLALALCTLLASIDALHRHTNGRGVVRALSVSIVARLVLALVFVVGFAFPVYRVLGGVVQAAVNSLNGLISVICILVYPLLAIWILRRAQVRAMGH